MTLVEQLERIRRERGLSDERFAGLLDISRNLWIDTRAGRAPVRFELLAAATQIFGDELEQAVIDYLRTAPRRKQSSLAAVGA
jgi:transcriptional regulator with XRE-family HTH domain